MHVYSLQKKKTHLQKKIIIMRTRGHQAQLNKAWTEGLIVDHHLTFI